MRRTRLSFDHLEARDTPCVRAAEAATPNNNPGTAQAIAAMPADVFAEHVRPGWFGRGANEAACDHAHNAR